MIENQYPIGKYEPKDYNEEQKSIWINDIKFLPDELENSILNLDEAQLQTPYRDGGWTVHQVVHHVADSHMNALIRFKLGLTESNPTIKPYLQDEWTALQDVQKLPVNISLTLLHALHKRWHILLESFKDGDWNKTVIHPEHNKQMSLWHLLGMYAWHGKHHTAQIIHLRKSKGWN